MDKLFKEESKKIRIYMTTEVETDPYEHTVEHTNLNPLPIRALISDLIASQLNWKMPGIATESAKELIIEKKYRTLLEKSHLIEIDDDYYEGWKINGRMQIKVIGKDYLRVYVYLSKVEN